MELIQSILTKKFNCRFKQDFFQSCNTILKKFFNKIQGIYLLIVHATLEKLMKYFFSYITFFDVFFVYAILYSTNLKFMLISFIFCHISLWFYLVILSEISKLIWMMGWSNILNTSSNLLHRPTISGQFVTQSNGNWSWTKLLVL